MHSKDFLGIKRGMNMCVSEILLGKLCGKVHYITYQRILLYWHRSSSSGTEQKSRSKGLFVCRIK